MNDPRYRPPDPDDELDSTLGGPRSQRVRPEGPGGPDRPSGQPPIARWLPAMAAVGVLLIVVVAAALGGDDGGSAGDLGAPTDNSDYAVTGLTVPDSVMPVVGTESTATPLVKTALVATIGFGSAGPDVTAVQTRLADLGFAPGVLDGNLGSQTQQAVWAFEKLVLGTPRADATGKVTNEMWQRMQDPIAIQPRRQLPGTHVEIYLPEQVAAVFTENVAVLVIHISSGDDQEWCETVSLDTDAQGNKLDPPVEKAVCGNSKTPGGVFKFDRLVVGKRNGPLGGMDNPVYFNYGIAMHGAQNIPLEPVSHGCIRMHKTISDSFQSIISIGDRVYVWGQDGKQPEQYTKQESLPVFNYPDPSATTTTTIAATTTTVAPTTTIAATTTSNAPTPVTTTTAAPAPTTAAPTTTAAPPSETTTTVSP